MIEEELSKLKHAMIFIYKDGNYHITVDAPYNVMCENTIYPSICSRGSCKCKYTTCGGYGRFYINDKYMKNVHSIFKYDKWDLQINDWNIDGSTFYHAMLDLNSALRISKSTFLMKQFEQGDCKICYNFS